VDTVDERQARGRLELLLLDRVRIAAWDRLLFVECGDGWLPEEAWRRMGKGRVYGLSTSPELVEVAVRLRGIPGRVEFGTWGGERLPVPDRSFDRVISCVPLGCYPVPVAVLREMARVLEPDGDAYLLGFARLTAEPPQASPTVDLGRLLAAAGLGAVQWHYCDAAPSGWVDGTTPVVIHARRCPAAPGVGG
jgi:SAM-dependent methyltransferase